MTRCVLLMSTKDQGNFIKDMRKPPKSIDKKALENNLCDAITDPHAGT